MATSDINQDFALASIPRRGRAKARWKGQFPAATDGNSCLYAIRMGPLPYVKIGRSRQPYVRMSEVQTGSAFDLLMLGFIEALHSEVVSMEATIHRRLKASGASGVGEWWGIEDDMAMRLLRWAAVECGAHVVRMVGGGVCPTHETDDSARKLREQLFGDDHWQADRALSRRQLT